MALGGFLKGLGRGLLKSVPIIGPAFDVLGGISQGRAAGRLAEANAAQNADYLRLAGERLNLDAPKMRARNAVRGDLLAGLQDVNVGAPRGTRLTGGTRPSLLSADSRALGKSMSREALLGQMRGPAFTPTRTPQAGKLDSILNALGYVGTGLGAANAAGVFNLRPPPAQPPMELDPAPWAKVRF